MPEQCGSSTFGQNEKRQFAKSVPGANDSRVNSVGNISTFASRWEVGERALVTGKAKARGVTMNIKVRYSLVERVKRRKSIDAAAATLREDTAHRTSSIAAISIIVTYAGAPMIYGRLPSQQRIWWTKIRMAAVIAVRSHKP